MWSLAATERRAEGDRSAAMESSTRDAREAREARARLYGATVTFADKKRLAETLVSGLGGADAHRAPAPAAATRRRPGPRRPRCFLSGRSRRSRGPASPRTSARAGLEGRRRLRVRARAAARRRRRFDRRFRSLRRARRALSRRDRPRRRVDLRGRGRVAHLGGRAGRDGRITLRVGGVGSGRVQAERQLLDARRPAAAAAASERLREELLEELFALAAACVSRFERRLGVKFKPNLDRASYFFSACVRNEGTSAE